VLFFSGAEIKIGKDIAQKNQSTVSMFAQHAQGVARAAHVRAEVQIGEDQRVKNLRVAACDATA